jgi:heme/copper-type cytochrome/quinol oxidase subunit 1
VWGAYGIMLAGLVIAAAGILSNTSSVIYTFYPPLAGHWSFYTGLALVVVASLMVGAEVVRLRMPGGAPRTRARPRRSSPTCRPSLG